MANMIRNDTRIKGIEMPDGNQVKISQYADDTVIILRDWSTFTHVKKWIHFFCQASGMKLNKNKTEGMWLGNLADIPQLRLRTYDQHKICLLYTSPSPRDS